MGEVIDITTGRPINEVPSTEELKAQIECMEPAEVLGYTVAVLANQRRVQKRWKRSGIDTPGFRNANLLVGRMKLVVDDLTMESALGYVYPERGFA